MALHTGIDVPITLVSMALIETPKSTPSMVTSTWRRFGSPAAAAGRFSIQNGMKDHRRTPMPDYSGTTRMYTSQSSTGKRSITARLG